MICIVKWIQFGLTIKIGNMKIIVLILFTFIFINLHSFGQDEAFVFNNPNIKGTCGCGESFSV